MWKYFETIKKVVFFPSNYRLVPLESKPLESKPLESKPLESKPVEEVERSVKSFLWLNRERSNKNYSYKNKLPISVIMPTIKSRSRFTGDFVIPMLKLNNPAEIIIVDDEDLGVQEKRNKGASKATQEYMFFCDDDTLLPQNHLAILFKVLEENKDCDYAYTDYQAIVMDPSTHARKNNYYHRASDFNLELLKQGNYVDTSSLLRRNKFPGFDPEIKRLQDWDLWLTISLKGSKGIYVKETGIIKYYLDEGITSIKNDLNMATAAVYKKHKI